VPPPGQGNDNGPHDQWGPGTRVPPPVLGPPLKGPLAADHPEYDRTTGLATIEARGRRARLLMIISMPHPGLACYGPAAAGSQGSPSNTRRSAGSTPTCCLRAVAT